MTKTEQSHLARVSGLMKMLSDETRIRLVFVLASGEQNVGDICKILKMPQPTISHHLKLLRMANIVKSKRQHRKIFYSLNHDEVKFVHDIIDNIKIAGEKKLQQPRKAKAKQKKAEPAVATPQEATE